MSSSLIANFYIFFFHGGKGTSFAIILEASFLLHTHTARAKKRPHVASAKSAQHPVIIQTSVNSANFGITRFKSNRRNSTECRFSASGADNTCRSGANQRKMSRQEASSQLPDLLCRISSDSFRRATLSSPSVASDFSRVSSRRWFRNLKPLLENLEPYSNETERSKPERGTSKEFKFRERKRESSESRRFIAKYSRLLFENERSKGTVKSFLFGGDTRRDQNRGLKTLMADTYRRVIGSWQLLISTTFFFFFFSRFYEKRTSSPQLAAPNDG